MSTDPDSPALASGVTFASLDLDASELRFQRLRADLGITTFGLNLIALPAGRRLRIHDHYRQEEVYLVLDGVLTLMVENVAHDLPRGGAARVGPGTRRQLVNRGPGDVLLLALGGATAHEGRDGAAYETWDASEPGRPPQEVPLPGDLPAGERR